MSEILHPVGVHGTSRSSLTSLARFAETRTGEKLEAYPALHAFPVEDFQTFCKLLLQ